MARELKKGDRVRVWGRTRAGVVKRVQRSLQLEGTRHRSEGRVCIELTDGLDSPPSGYTAWFERDDVELEGDQMELFK